jgi:hypothetical protein
MRQSGIILGGVAAFALAVGSVAPGSASAQTDVQEIRWGTSSVGSSGHRALVNLSATLNRELDAYNITVLPMPGAMMTVRNYAMKKVDGYYGADIAFHELATNSGRFKGFRDKVEREPVQSFWAYTLEMGLAIHADARDDITEWRDLADSDVFTGPRPWDTRAHLKRVMSALDVGHDYVELDLGVVGSELERGNIDAFSVYTAGESDVSPWIAEAELSTDIAVLNPSKEERKMLREKGLDLVSVSPDVFETDVHVDEVIVSPFYYGLHLGTTFSKDEVYKILTTIEANTQELKAADPAFSQIHENMPEMQRRGVRASVDDVKVHPGLAKYMRERGVWNEAWNDRIAETM